MPPRIPVLLTPFSSAVRRKTRLLQSIPATPAGFLRVSIDYMEPIMKVYNRLALDETHLRLVNDSRLCSMEFSDER